MSVSIVIDMNLSVEWIDEFSETAGLPCIGRKLVRPTRTIPKSWLGQWRTNTPSSLMTSISGRCWR